MLKLNLSKINSIQDILVIYITNESSYSQEQVQKLEAKRAEFLGQKADLIILDTQTAISDGLYLKLKDNQQGVLVVNSNGELIWHKMEISFLDLGQAMVDFLHNYHMDVQGVDLLAWGNKMLEEGDYMCNDCGYILTVKTGTEYEPGMVFPTCDVCQSGEPEGPTGTIEPFWQKL